MAIRLFYLAVLSAFLLSAGCDQQTPVAPPEALSSEEQLPTSEAEGFARWTPCQGSIRVMTRNVYVGAYLDSIYRVQDPIPVIAWAVQMMLSTNFYERAQAIAKEVALGQPHLIGLQEISLFRIQSPGDLIAGGTIPATDIWFDYLDILLNALQEKGLDYRVAGIVENFDVEVPLLTGFIPPATYTFDDIRLTDYDVVLARNDVVVANVEAQNYQEYLPVPQFGLALKRGYVALDATVEGKTYRFVNTHFESETEPIRFAQAEELMATLQNETKPVILVGDLNSWAPEGPTYQCLLSQNFVDTWTRNLVAFLNPDGYTADHDSDLRNTTVNLDHRIDLILVRSNVWLFNRQVIGPVLSFVVGDELRDRTPSGLWPSDHAGVIARLQIPVRHN
jgi:hypothetical protein